MILSPGVSFLSCSTSGQGHQPERTLSVASPGATVQWLRPRRKFSQNLVVKNKPFVVLKDAVGQNSDRALCGQLVSASCCLESHLEKSKAGGRSPLKASSSACWGVDGGCWLGPQCLSVSGSVWLTLGFLKARWPDHKDGSGGRRSHIPFYDPGLGGTWCNFPNSLCVELREGKIRAS